MGDVVVVNQLQRIGVRAFCLLHNLIIDVNERYFVPESEPGRYYARICGVEIMDDGMLIGAFGNGRTAGEAIAAMCREYSNQRLVHNAYRPDRREFEPVVFVDDVQTGPAI